jgi:hypothetical protein
MPFLLLRKQLMPVGMCSLGFSQQSERKHLGCANFVRVGVVGYQKGSVV